MKNTKENISLYEVNKLKQQQKLLLNELNAVPASSLPSTAVTENSSKGKGKPSNAPIDKIDSSNAILIGDISNSHTHPFLLNFEIFKNNVHSSLVDSIHHQISCLIQFVLN